MFYRLAISRYKYFDAHLKQIYRKYVTLPKKGNIGYDAGKKVKGRKRHITTDTLGLVLSCEVHAADVQDLDGAKDVLAKCKAKCPTVVKFFTAGGYAGALQIWCFLTLGTLLAIARKFVDQVGFKVIPKRWIADRTFSRFNNFRRMSKDYEHNPKTSEHIIYINMITVMLKRLA